MVELISNGNIRLSDFIKDKTVLKHGEVLIPAIKQCILDVNIEEGTMTVHLMEGLI